MRVFVRVSVCLSSSTAAVQLCFLNHLPYPYPYPRFLAHAKHSWLVEQQQWRPTRPRVFSVFWQELFGRSSRDAWRAAVKTQPSQIELLRVTLVFASVLLCHEYLKSRSNSHLLFLRRKFGPKSHRRQRVDLCVGVFVQRKHASLQQNSGEGLKLARKVRA